MTPTLTYFASLWILIAFLEPAYAIWSTPANPTTQYERRLTYSRDNLLDLRLASLDL